MSDARPWILAATATAFLAGAVAGVVYTRRAEAPAPSGWAAYAERLARDFELSPERRSALRFILDEYATEVTNRRRFHEARIEAEIEPELRELAARYDGYIRDSVLPPQQRARFDERSRPVPLVTAD